MNKHTIQQLQTEVKTAVTGKQFKRLKEVKSRVGLSRSTIYAMMAAKTFPQSISLGLRSVAWLESDIDQWIDSRVAASKAVA